MSFIDNLLETQHDSENPRLFEKAVTEAFRQLVEQAVHKGGSNEPDVLLDISEYKIVIDTKTTKEKVISEGYINFDALERYKEDYEADLVAVVAVGFSRGNVRDTAEKRGVVLIETEAICKTLENHIFYPYKPQHIYEMMFGRGRTVITPEDIEPSTKNLKGEIKIIEQVLSGLKRLHRANIDSLHLICRYVGLNVEKEEIEKALIFLSSPPLDIVKKEEETYSLTIDFDEILKRLALLHEALPTLKPISKSEKLGPNVYRKKLTFSDVKHKFINVSTRVRSLFPEPDVDFTIESNGKTYTVSFDKYDRIFSGMSKWYNDHPTVKEGDTILLERLRENVYRLTLE
ncbi:MAG: hypothetical protein NWE89_05310 [Candidatus Bathyarchaeota archaeon]|nr:hypothetical protein [Candidatus Bathyarchaeota archaeon]